MATCDYIYASGLRVESGAAVAVVDGRRLRIVRTGKGSSRLDRPSTTPPSDGEITLKDLKSVLAGSASPTVDVTVYTPHGEFRAALDPGRAMGRKGRQESFKDALAAMSPTERVIAAKYQLRTLPDGKKNADVARARLEEAVNHAGIAACVEFLPPQFADLASPELLASALRAADTTAAVRLAPDKVSDETLDRALDEAPFDVLRDALGRVGRSRAVSFAQALALRYPDRFLEIQGSASEALRTKQLRAVENAVLASLAAAPAGPDSPLRAVVLEATAALGRNPKDAAARDWLVRLAGEFPHAVLEAGAAPHIPAHYLARAAAAAPLAALDHAAAHLTPDRLFDAAAARPIEALTGHLARFDDAEVGYLFESVGRFSRPGVLSAGLLARLPADTWHRFVEDRPLIESIAADGTLARIIDECSDEQFTLLASRHEQITRSHPRFAGLAARIAEADPHAAPEAPVIVPVI